MPTSEQTEEVRLSDSIDEAKASDHHKGYQEYNKNLRMWFVAFGVGGVAILLTKENVLQTLSACHRLGIISLLFIIGSATQILIAFINKVECWYCYYYHVNPKYAKTKRGRFMLWLDHQFWIDVVCDLVTMVCYTISIILLFCSYVK